MQPSDNWEQLQQKVAAAALRSGRPADAVTVIAVSKTVDASQVAAAYQWGWRHFGENRPQELTAKQQALPHLDITWHMIGQLQRNKVRQVLAGSSYIHSLDRFSLAQELQRQGEKLAVASIPCFVEVNAANEANKSGISWEELPNLLHQLAQFPLLSLVGLMTIATIVQDPEEVRPLFRRLAQQRQQLQEELQQEGYTHAPLQHLSMGMSADFTVAIEEGADFVRIGTAIFVAR
ncbi:MAG: YggS family pyridoxal phosphate-dependent enzyme [Symbiobacteriaceae bacterium]|nr:YggS family pyridoxal phosphate-dependent enzyme [Symbiobacteriaceae bacterium]